MVIVREERTCSAMTDHFCGPCCATSASSCSSSAGLHAIFFRNPPAPRPSELSPISSSSQAFFGTGARFFCGGPGDDDGDDEVETDGETDGEREEVPRPVPAAPRLLLASAGSSGSMSYGI